MAKFPQKGKVTLLSVHSKSEKVFWASPVLDRHSGKYLGVPEMSIEKQKLELAKVITQDSQCPIRDGKTFDLDNSEIDRLEWSYVQHNREIVPSEEDSRKTPLALFYVFQPGAEAEKKVVTIREKAKALAIASELSLDKMRQYCSYWGIKTDFMTPMEIERQVLETAEKEPKKLIDASEDNDFKERLVIQQLVDARKIKKHTNGHYMYGDVLLGLNLKDAIAWFKDPKNRDVAGRMYMSLRKEAVLPGESLIDELESEIKKIEDEK